LKGEKTMKDKLNEMIKGAKKDLQHCTNRIKELERLKRVMEADEEAANMMKGAKP